MRRPSAVRRRWLLALLAVAALGVGVRLAAIAGTDECTVVDVLDPPAAPPACVDVTDATGYLNQARANAEGHWLQEPRALSGTGGGYVPTALHGPLYPLLLSVPWALGVHGAEGLRVVGALLGGATIVLAGHVGARVARPAVGLGAAALVAVHPLVWINDTVLLSEALFAPLALAGVLAALRLVERPSVGRAAAMGAVLGLAALTRAEAVVAAAAIAAALAWGLGDDAAGRARLALAALGATGLVLAPWVVVNEARFDRPVPLTTTAGFGGRLGNCEATYAGGERFAAQAPECVTDLRDPAVRERLGVRLGPDDDQSVVNAELSALNRRFVTDNLGRAPVVALARVGRMWGLYRPFQSIDVLEPVERRGVDRTRVGVALGWATSALAVPGALVLRRRGTPLTPLLAWVGTATLVAAANLPLLRFRAAADVVLCVLAAVAVDAWVRRDWAR